MSTKKVTPEEVLEAAAEKLGSKDVARLLQFLATEYAEHHEVMLGAVNEVEEIRDFHETVIACLVEKLGGEARISLGCIKDPPQLHKDDDPLTGEWIYTTRAKRRAV
jgi:1,4-dihydroxy-2-naphthoyl-CoA synthase